jgi:hypothetical protein
VFAASFLLYLWLAPRDPSAAFYLLPTRAWELALGSLAALLPWSERARKVMMLLSVPALLALLVVPVSSAALSPLIKLPVVCIATFIVIARTAEYDSSSPLVAALARVGDASLLAVPGALADHGLAQQRRHRRSADRTTDRVVLVAAVAAAFRPRLPVVPVRGAADAARAVATDAQGAAAGAGCVTAAGYVADGGERTDLEWRAGAAVRRASPRQPRLRTGLRVRLRLPAAGACRSGRAPRMLVWGDSFAMHLVPGLVATSTGGVAQATKSVCGPFIGLAQVTAEYPREYAEHCIAFNDSVLAYLAKTPSVRVVVLSSPFYPISIRSAACCNARWKGWSSASLPKRSRLRRCAIPSRACARPASAYSSWRRRPVRAST